MDISYPHAFDRGRGVLVISLKRTEGGILIMINASEKEHSENETALTVTTCRRSLLEALRWIDDHSWAIGNQIQLIFGLERAAMELSGFFRETTERIRQQQTEDIGPLTARG